MDNTLEKNHFLFSSESVGEGNSDKLCDQISDAILDACLKIDPSSKVACEVIAKDQVFFLLGEITMNNTINYEEIVRDTIYSAGYIGKSKGFDYRNIEVKTVIEEQGLEIAKAIHFQRTDQDLNAGDQSLVFGYATNEWDNKSLMPLSHYLANKLCERLSIERKETMKWLRPDCKSQVVIEYVKEGLKIKPVRIKSVTIFTQHDPNIDIEFLRKEVIEKVIKVEIPKKYLDDKIEFIVNPTGNFITGGTLSCSGLTGRKIIADTYGGWAPHGGGSFSGKDPSKVDRSSCYYCRYVAKNLVNSGLCDRVLIQVSYGIGIMNPLSIYVDSYGTAKEGMDDDKLLAIVKINFNFSPGRIIDELNLKKPIYKKTSVFGHFGRDPEEFPWEKTKKLILF